MLQIRHEKFHWVKFKCDKFRRRHHKDRWIFLFGRRKKYTITVSSGDEKVITELSVSLTNGIVPGTIHAYEQQLIKFNILQSDVYNLTTNHSDCVIEDIFTKTVSGLKSYSQYSEYSPHSTVSVPLDIGEYYVLIKIQFPQMLSLALMWQDVLRVISRKQTK